MPDFSRCKEDGFQNSRLKIGAVELPLILQKEYPHTPRTQIPGPGADRPQLLAGPSERRPRPLRARGLAKGGDGRAQPPPQRLEARTGRGRGNDGAELAGHQQQLKLNFG